MSTAEILDLSARGLADAIAARKLSCLELMNACLDRIEALNPRHNAIVSMRPREALRAEAREADAALARGERLGPLHGIPFAVKYTAALKGFPMTKGSPLLRDLRPEADSLMVERLRAAGVIFIGKTNVPEFALGSQTTNPIFGATRNAYDPALTSGGSSGGAAVALALRMLPLADGSDYGGSLRNPAGWNNVYGFRPSIGRVPSDGPDLWLPSLSVLGPMARDVDDLALLFSIQAGPDPRAPLALDGPALASGDFEPRGKRIAWLGDFGGALPFEPGVLDVAKSALKTFEDMGVEVEEARIDFSFEELWSAFLTIRHWQIGASLIGFYRDPAKRALLKDEAIYEVEGGLKLSAFDISRASETRSRWSLAVADLLRRYDAFALPTAQVFAFDVETLWPREIAGRAMRSYHEWMQCVIPATMAGSPTIALPAGFDARGRAMGLQLAGPPRGDGALLQLARAYDLRTRWPERMKPVGPFNN